MAIVWLTNWSFFTFVPCQNCLFLNVIRQEENFITWTSVKQKHSLVKCSSLHVCSGFLLLLHECAVIWVGLRWKCHGQSRPITWNPIFLGLNACVCIYLLTRHGEFYIREDMPGSCLCLMRQRSLFSLRWAYYTNQTLRPCLISQSVHLNSLLSEDWEEISSVSSSTWTTACWTSLSLSGSSDVDKGWI